MCSAESFAAFTAHYGLSDVPAIADPERRLYRVLGLRRGRFAQLLGFGVWWRGFTSLLAGHHPGALDGDGTQMPGVFSFITLGSCAASSMPMWRIVLTMSTSV